MLEWMCEKNLLKLVSDVMVVTVHPDPNRHLVFNHYVHVLEPNLVQ